MLRRLARLHFSSQSQMQSLAYWCLRQVGASAMRKKLKLLTVRTSCHTDIKYGTINKAPAKRVPLPGRHGLNSVQVNTSRGSMKGEKIHCLLCSLDCVLISEQTSYHHWCNQGDQEASCTIPPTKTCIKGKRQKSGKTFLLATLAELGSSTHWVILPLA